MKTRPDGEGPVAGREIVVGAAGDRGGPVQIAVDGLGAPGTHGGHGPHPGNLAGDGLGVVVAEGHGAGTGAARTVKPLARPDLQQIAAQAGDLLGDLHGGALAQSHQGDHRRHPDDDAEDGERGAQDIAADLPLGQLHGFPEHQACPPALGVGDDQPVEKMDLAPGIFRHVRFVGDHQHGQLALPVEAGDQLHHFMAAGRIQVAGGFVGQQHPGFGDDGPGDGDALLLAAGKFARGMVLPAGKPNCLQGLPGAVPPLGVGHPAIDQGQLHIFQGRGPVQQIESLEDETQDSGGGARPVGRGSSARPRPLRRGNSPAVGVSRQPKMFMQVDLPEPLGPMIATNSPCSMARSMPRRADMAAGPVP